MKALITGATGMVGSLVLQHCIESPELTKVVSLSRRRSDNCHDKVEEIIVKDFLNFDEEASYFRDVDVIFYCLGVYTGAVNKAKFHQITIDYPETLARIIFRKSPQARFCLLSGAGADRTEKSSMAFAKAKGAIENRLAAMELGAFHSFRPGCIYPVIPRQEPSFTYRLTRWLYPIIRLLGDNASIRSTELAEAMFKVGLSGHSLEVMENQDIVQLRQSVCQRP